MKDALYLQYLVIRPMGVSPDSTDFDRKAEFLLHMILDDERLASVLADKKHCQDCHGRMMSFIVKIPHAYDGWYPPQNLSIRGDRIYEVWMYEGEWIDHELSTTVDHIYCLE